MHCIPMAPFLVKWPILLYLVAKNEVPFWRSCFIDHYIPILQPQDCPLPSTLHCTALHCLALQIALNCTELQYTTLHFTALLWTTLLLVCTTLQRRVGASCLPRAGTQGADVTVLPIVNSHSFPASNWLIAQFGGCRPRHPRVSHSPRWTVQ